MLEIGLRDGMFPQAASMSAGGENAEMAPAHFRWNREARLPITFYTDHCIWQAAEQDWPGRKVALLIEAPKFRPKHYEDAIKYEHLFDYVLTYHRDLLETRDPQKWLYYPHGGSRIRREHWGIRPKWKLVSFLASAKKGAEGHDFRHEVFHTFGSRLDCYGPITGGPLVPKRRALEDYYFSVVVAGERGRGLFCDHILDCFLLGTVPIYWKRFDIEHYFWGKGIFTFETLDDLDEELKQISLETYFNRLPEIFSNLSEATKYVCAEDWIWRHYPFIFKEVAP